MEIRKLIKDKKGLGIGDLYPTILTIAVVAILLGITITVLTEWTRVTNKLEATVINETITPTDAGVFVSNASMCGFSDSTLISAWNDTQIIHVNNYTYDGDIGLFKNLTSEYTVFDWNVTYDFNYGGKDCEAVEDIIEAYTDFLPWIGIILLVIAAAIVLGIVISSFAGRRGP